MIEDIETIFPQVLLMGNGINLAYGGVSWNNLLSDISKRKDLDFNKLKCPMPLKAVLVTNNHIREALMSYKGRLYGEVKTEQQLYALQRLLEMEFDHIITTNYSYELEIAAHDGKMLSDGRITKLMEHTEAVNKAEPKYFMHTYNRVEYMGNIQKIWHIHGEARKPDSMILGHYHYGNYFTKIKNYLDKSGNKYFVSEKQGNIAPVRSWTDAFILGDVYVLGFGYDVSEFDMWWLLDRKQRENAKTGKIYYYAPRAPKFDEKIELLKVFDKVEIIHCGVDLPQEPDDAKDNSQVSKYRHEKARAYKSFYDLALDDIEGKLLKVKMKQEAQSHG